MQQAYKPIIEAVIRYGKVIGPHLPDLLDAAARIAKAMRDQRSNDDDPRPT